MSGDLWTHIGFARAAAVLAERAGLHFAPTRQPAAESAMRRVQRDFGIAEPIELARRVAREDPVLDALLAEVTIGETYFFRESGQLDVLRDVVFPGFRARRGAARPLRVWSAGCASGEEPYTLAILLREGGWRNGFTVLGTDVARPRLHAAERGRYTRWSLRGVAEERVTRYFIQRGSHYFLRPELRAAVEFRPLNLADDGWPGGESGIGAMDVVLCRNVLIYFDRDTVAAVARRLLASLGDDGWLLLGASDPMLADLVPCETVVTGAGLAYRRQGAGGDVVRAWPGLAAAPAAAAAAVEVVSPFDPAAFLPPATADAAVPADAPPPIRPTVAAPGAAPGDPAARAEAARAALADRPDDAAAWAGLVRALGDAGQVEEAERLCAAALDRCPASAELAYLHAVLLAHGGHHGASAAAARRALYVDRSLAVAQLALGAALVREGHAAAARRAFRAAERLLAAIPADAPAPLADGEPAGRLLEAARAQLRRLEAVA